MKFTELGSARRGRLASLRIDLGKQVSSISPARVFKSGDFSFEPTETWDQTDELEITNGGGIHSVEARIAQPGYLEVATTIPLQIYGGAGETDFLNAEAIKISRPHYDEATTIIPLYTNVNSVEIDPPVDIRVTNINLNLEPADLDLYDFQLDTHISTAVIPFDLFSLEKIQIFGMNYADKHWHKISVVEDKVPHGKTPSSHQRQKGGLLEPQKRGRKPKPQQPLPSVWDLLFAVLQPPLNFGYAENVFLPNAPYSYQWQGIEFLTGNEHALLADDMGTGKTVMTIVSLKILIQRAKAHHVLILCPPSVLYEWKRHLDDWAAELSAYLIRSPQKEVRKSLWDTPMHIYVTTYDTLKRDIENNILSKKQMRRFDTVVLDEAHHIKNEKSKRFRAIKQLQPERRWALTGTPIQNKIEDLASIFEFVYPGYLTSFDLRSEQLQKRIKPYFLRRRKKEVMPELPPKIYEPIELELDTEQEKAYELAEAGIRIEFDKALARGEKITKQHIFAKLTQLKKICNFAPGKLSGPKTDTLKEQIEEIIEGGRDETGASENKVIVFSQFIEEGISKLERILEQHGTAKIVGGQSDATRRAEIEKFKSRKDIPILLASVRSGGEGLNLTEASYVVHFDHWWNPAVMWQAEDRVHRRGQTRGVNVYSYWMRNTIDERIRQKLHEKGMLFDQVVDGLAMPGDRELLQDQGIQFQMPVGFGSRLLQQCPYRSLPVLLLLLLSLLQRS